MVSPDSTTTYWAVVTGVNGCPSDTAFATVTVLPLPDCFITGPDTLCPLGTAQYIAPDTMVSYAWTISGPGIILGDTSLQIIDVQGTGSCDSSFILELTITGSNGCSNTCMQIVSLFDTLPPQFTYVPDTLWLECASGVPPASVDSVAVADNCNGNIILTVADSVLNDSCANQFNIIRTWTATDTCGNTSTASQYIMVFDSIAPVFTYVPDTLWLECASGIPPASVDSVAVADNCTNGIALAVADSIVNEFCLNQYDIIRTWTATDTCGNTSVASQYIIIFDSIAPVLYDVPADTGVCCADSIPPPVAVTAFDNCDGDLPVTLTEVVSDSTGPLYFTLTRIWMASDICGNMIADSMVIEVNDTLYQSDDGGIVDIDDKQKITLYFRIAPNPFNQETTITFSPAKDAYVDLDLYNPLGVKLRSLYSGFLDAGSKVNIPLQGKNMVQGMYYLVLKTKHGIETRRIILKN